MILIYIPKLLLINTLNNDDYLAPPQPSPKGRENAENEIFLCAWQTFQRRRLEERAPPNPLKGELLDCAVNEILFGAWQLFNVADLKTIGPLTP